MSDIECSCTSNRTLPRNHIGLLGNSSCTRFGVSVTTHNSPVLTSSGSRVKSGSRSDAHLLVMIAAVRFGWCWIVPDSGSARRGLAPVSMGTAELFLCGSAAFRVRRGLLRDVVAHTHVSSPAKKRSSTGASSSVAV
jgi:hypothetical protein